MRNIGAVVLAAGLSSRLAAAGEFKPLTRLAGPGEAGEQAGQTLLERAAVLFRAAGVADILVVAGHRAGETRAEAERLGLASVENPDHARGMFTSVCAGLAALLQQPGEVQAAFVLPVDIPLVRPHTLRALLEEPGAGRETVLHPAFPSRGGRRGHPPLIPARFFPSILAWAKSDQDTGGLAGALARLPAREVAVADRNIHFDVDTPEDLQEARRRAARLDIPTPEEAVALMELCGAGERGLAHGRGVAQAALAMARALMARGAALDLELVESAALLHDMAKGQPGHERAGAAQLEALGYGPVARIVAAHRDIAPDQAPQITERELVYLADKLVRGSTRVSVEARFRQKLELFAHDAEACAAIRRRLANALAMRERVETAAGARLDELVPLRQPS